MASADIGNEIGAGGPELKPDRAIARPGDTYRAVVSIEPASTLPF